MSNSWTMEEAKEHFTAIAEAAYSGHPQYVTNSSHPDLVIFIRDIDDKEKQKEEENKRFVEFLMSGPKGEIFPDGDTPSEIISSELQF